TAAPVTDPRSSDPRARLRDSSIQVSAGPASQALPGPRAAAQARQRATVEPGAEVLRTGAPVAAMSLQPQAPATPAGAAQAEDGRVSLLADLAANAPAAHIAPPALAGPGPST